MCNLNLRCTLKYIHLAGVTALPRVEKTMVYGASVLFQALMKVDAK